MSLTEKISFSFGIITRSTSTETEDCPGTKLSRNGVEVKKENENIVVCSRSQQNLEFEDGKEMYQNLKRNCGAIVFAH